MGILDAINSEDRIQTKFSDFYNLVKGCTQRDQMLNAINCNVPHRYIREMVTGQSEEPVPCDCDCDDDTILNEPQGTE